MSADLITQNYASVGVTFYGSTNCRGSRVRLAVPQGRKPIFFDYDYRAKSLEEMAERWLLAAVFRAIATTTYAETTIILVDVPGLDRLWDNLRALSK